MADKEKKDRVEIVRTILLQLMQDPEVLATCRGFYQEMQRPKEAVGISSADIPATAEPHEQVNASEQVTKIAAQESKEENKLKEKNAELEKKLTASKTAQQALKDQLQALHQNLEQEKQYGQQLLQERDEAQLDYGTAQNRIDELKQELQKTKQELQMVQKQYKSLERKKNDLQNQNDNISNQLQKTKQDLQISQQQYKLLERKRDDLKRQNDDISQRLQRTEESLRAQQSHAERMDRENANLREQLSEEQQVCRTLEKDKQSLQGQLNREQQVRRGLENDKQRLQSEKRALQQQLQERFEPEWQVYQQYLACSSEGKSSVSRVLHGATSFEAFVCNGAQAKVLGFVWDAIRDAQRRKDDESEKIMRELFHSCLKLVNYARSDDERYELLNTAPGDDQDDVTQNYPPSSRAQGRVKEVLIHGYRNGYNNKVERKSLVVLG